MRMLERGMRFAAAPRRLEAAYEDEMDAEHMEPVEEEDKEEGEASHHAVGGNGNGASAVARTETKGEAAAAK